MHLLTTCTREFPYHVGYADLAALIVNKGYGISCSSLLSPHFPELGSPRCSENPFALLPIR